MYLFNKYRKERKEKRLGINTQPKRFVSLITGNIQVNLSNERFYRCVYYTYGRLLIVDTYYYHFEMKSFY